MRRIGGARHGFVCVRASSRRIADDAPELQVLIAELILASTPPDEIQLTEGILARLRADELLSDRGTRR